MRIILMVGTLTLLAFAIPHGGGGSAIAADALPPPTESQYSLHWQATTVTQGHGESRVSFPPLDTTLSPAQEIRTSFTTTLFGGVRLTEGLELYVNPEVSAGSGVSGTHGIAGYPNGEIYRVDTPDPKFNLSRLYVKKIWNLGEGRQAIEPDLNQIATTYDTRRVTLIAGKMSLNDFFDTNSYSHDPRTQFLNWALMDNGAWDYAADTRGYSVGFVVEYNESDFAVRFGSVLEPLEANQMTLDTNVLQARGDNLEVEYRYRWAEHPGKLRALGYMNHARMGSYAQSLANPTPDGVQIVSTRDYRTKYGAGLNWEQELTSRLGMFGRIGWNDGATETWAFTEIDSTFSLGLSWQPWEARTDRVGAAIIVNGISDAHLHYLAAGGQGFMIGDGAGNLDYAPEQIAEIYYSMRVYKRLSATADVQLVNHPAYNQNRPGVGIFAARLHYEL